MDYVFLFSKLQMEARRNQSLDDFFQDFNEIISSEMKTPTPAPEHEHRSAATNMIPYDQSNAYNSTASGVDFNLDLTQFYINTNESDFLNSDELKPDFPNGMIQFSPSQLCGIDTYQDKVVDDRLAFSVMDVGTKKRGNKYNLSNRDVADDNIEFSVMEHSHRSTEMATSPDTKISVTTPLNQFYLDIKVNGEVTSTSNEDNSIVTYISKDALQSVEYINESGHTETVMYVDQESDGIDIGKSGSGITQYEIINFDEYQYETVNVDSLQHGHEVVEMNVPNSKSVPYYGDNVDINHQTDILSTLLSDKSNKIVIIAKPLKNPKVRKSTDELFLKFEEIDNNPTNIVLATKPKGRSCRKQKLETINQIELDFVETKCDRPKFNEPVAKIPNVIPETPKLPSKYMRDRRNNINMQVRRKRPRKLCWDSDDDIIVN